MNSLDVQQISEDLNKRMAVYTDSRQPTDDEVRLALLLCHIHDLNDIIAGTPFKPCNIIDRDTNRMCREPGMINGACYDHCVPCTRCDCEPAHPDEGTCVKCTAELAVQSFKTKHDKACSTELVKLNAHIVEGQFTPREDGSDIGDLWEGVVTTHGCHLKIHAWLRDAVTFHSASVGDCVTCDLVKGLKETNGQFTEAGYRVVSGTLKISKK